MVRFRVKGQICVFGGLVPGVVCYRVSGCAWIKGEYSRVAAIIGSYPAILTVYPQPSEYPLILPACNPRILPTITCTLVRICEGGGGGGTLKEHMGTSNLCEIASPGIARMLIGSLSHILAQRAERDPARPRLWQRKLACIAKVPEAVPKA